jgi:hypothetical protein
MKRKFCISLLIIMVFGLSANYSKAQYFETPTKKAPVKDKFFYGGGLGLQFGTVTAIEFSPMVGYKLTSRFHPGISATYSYYHNKMNTFTYEYSTYGASTFFRFFLFEGVFAHAEVEALNIKVFNTLSDTYRKWIDNYLVGGGYFQKIGEKSGMYFTVLWNLNQTEFTPTSNPQFKIGFNF